MRADILAVAAGALTLAAFAPGAVRLAGGTGLGPANDLHLPTFRAAPAAELTITRAHEYVMSGAVRPLLFWISRDDVGLARIVWREGADGARGYELLVGTDPARAPRGINRWGFVSEERHGAGGSLLALMTGSHDTSYDAEAAAVSHGSGKGDFRAIRSRTNDGITVWQLARLQTPDAMTVHQVAKVLEHAGNNGVDEVRRQRAVARDVRPGFLVAVADILGDEIASPQQRPQPKSVQYVFGSRIYDLRVRRTEHVGAVCKSQSVPALRTSFEIRTLETGETTPFELTAGAAGQLAGVPLAIEWQPRWWLRVHLRHVDCP